MAPFMRPGEGGMKMNWQRIIELIVIVLLNAAVLITTLQMKISYMEKTIDRLEKIVAANDGRMNTVEAQTAVCMDRLRAKTRGWN
jgi:uncharacterized coiled-coil protein SlyX